MKKQISYICDSIAVGWMFTSGFTFNPRSKATNIGYLFFAKLIVLSCSKQRTLFIGYKKAFGAAYGWNFV